MDALDAVRARQYHWAGDAMKTLFWILLPLHLAVSATAASPAREIVLVQPAQVTAENARAWKAEGFTAAAVILDSEIKPSIPALLSDAGLEYHLWIEIARQPGLADAHPRWMASLGVHDDWLRRYPRAVAPKPGEVAKAWPWVTIRYREAFDAQLARLRDLLDRAPSGWRSVLLNDLQGGPSSCGCGNLQCRWATDYHVSSTGERMNDDDAAARFLAAVRAHVPGKTVVPVWTTECEHDDLPASKRKGAPSTGLCGGVGCATGLCPKEYTKQWSAVLGTNDHPIALLGLHGELERRDAGAAWITNALAYLDGVPPAHGGRSLPRERLWLVVHGLDTAQEKVSRKLAATLGAAIIIVARTKIDQSYEPRVIPLKRPVPPRD